MEQRRRQTSVEQLTLLVEYLEQHKDLALGRARSKEALALAARLWRECSLILNSEGSARTGKEWAKVWNDLKCRVRAKLISINANHTTGGGPSTAASLTPLEERIKNIMGRDVGPLSNVRQDPLASQNDINHNEENVNAALAVENQSEQLDSKMRIDLAAVHEGIAHESPVHESVAPSPTPSVTGQVPSTPRSSRNRNRLRRQRQRDRRTAARLSVPSIDESRTMMLHIENMRAEAALVNAQAGRTMSESFKLLAESIDRFTRQYARREAEAPAVKTENC